MINVRDVILHNMIDYINFDLCWIIFKPPSRTLFNQRRVNPSAKRWLPSKGSITVKFTCPRSPSNGASSYGAVLGSLAMSTILSARSLPLAPARARSRFWNWLLCIAFGVWVENPYIKEYRWTRTKQARGTFISARDASLIGAELFTFSPVTGCMAGSCVIVRRKKCNFSKIYIFHSNWWRHAAKHYGIRWRKTLGIRWRKTVRHKVTQNSTA